MFKRIETKVLVLFVVNVLLWVSFVGFIFYFIAARSLEKQVDTNLKTTANVVASQWDGSVLMLLQPGMEKAPFYQSLHERLKLLKEKTQVENIYIASPSRENILSTVPGFRIGQPLPRLDVLRSEVAEALNGRVVTSKLIRVNDRQYKSAIAPVYSSDKVVALLMVDMSPWYLVYLKSFRNSLVIFSVISLCCCVLTARIFSRSITRPISHIAKRVEEISEAQYETPLQVSGHDEVAQLASSIETMRKNILHRDAQMKMMLSGIAHEIRNPLGGIELFAGILEKEKLEPEELEYVQKIKTEIMNLKKLLTEFLDFARPRNLEYEQIRISDLMSEIEPLIRKDLNRKQGRWLLEIHPEIGTVEADRSKLKQALLNLYQNAFQAIPIKGEVCSRVRSNGGSIVMEISNTQTHSLDTKVAEKIFEPFFTTKEKGMGLGLPLARDIIEAHGGNIFLSENDASRITFAVHLPAHRTETVNRLEVPTQI